MMFKIKYKYYKNGSRLLGHKVNTREKIYGTYKDSLLGYMLYIGSYACCVGIAVALSRTSRFQDLRRW